MLTVLMIKSSMRVDLLGKPVFIGLTVTDDANKSV